MVRMALNGWAGLERFVYFSLISIINKCISENIRCSVPCLNRTTLGVPAIPCTGCFVLYTIPSGVLR